MPSGFSCTAHVPPAAEEPILIGVHHEARHPGEPIRRRHTAEDVERNLTYAREALRDSLLRGEAPIASHLLYTQKGVLDDRIREERGLGIAAGLAWGVAEMTVVYADLGI